MMKKTIINNLFKTGLISGILLLNSCMSEEPFKNEGDSLVKFNVSVNTLVTRAITEEETLKELNDKCVIFISSNEGILHKWEGISNIPADGVYLKYGDYTALAWSGDSIPASYKKKFYRGSQTFTVNETQANTQVTVNCKIRNVVTSIDISKLEDYLASDLTVSFTNAGNSLVFSGDQLADKGYFMIPFIESIGDYDRIIDFEITGKDIDGSVFTKTGRISNVTQCHEYRLIIENTGTGGQTDNKGGANIKITIDDYNVYDAEAVIIGAPQFAWDADNSDIETPVTRNGDSFDDYSFLVAAYQDFSSITLTSSDNEINSILLGNNTVELIDISDNDKNLLAENGITFNYGQHEADNIKVYRVTLSSLWLNKLAKRDDPYSLHVAATDLRGSSNTAILTIVNTSTPFVIKSDFADADLLAVGAYSVTIPFEIDGNFELDNLIAQYRIVGESEWTSKNLPLTKATTRNIVLDNLSSGQQYECRLVAGEFDGEKYTYETSIIKFKTEEVYKIPNANMEDWSSGKSYNGTYTIQIPSATGLVEYWDTGNHGSATLNKTITDGKVFNPTYGTSACLMSQFVGVGIAGKFAAGNLFFGKYKETTGTNGIIDFGREYNGTHPKALKVKVNYRPKEGVRGKGAKDGYVAVGEYDQAQIYVAISNGVRTVNTGNESTLVTSERVESFFLGYGQHTFESDFGDEGELKEVEIPIQYFENAHNTKPTHLIIVCSASKYGDYFSGGDGSVMYVDDFELIY